LTAIKNTPFHGDAEAASQTHRFIDFKRSKGSFFRDIDGNTVLDLNAAAHG
jgi:4-aminobutyrate aminotransferase-like enzyme